MIRFETSSLRSKVARRIFWVFLSCALLPCAGLIVVSYLQIENFFFDKSERQLRDLAKLFGLDVHERLMLLDESLKIVASLTDSTAATMEPNYVSDRLAAQKGRWRSLTLVTGDGQYRQAAGTECDNPRCRHRARHPVLRRRRQCLACQRRFTSYERIDEIPYMVVKKDGRRERFDRQVILRVLERVRWNQSEAARLLGLHRNSLKTKLLAWGIDPVALASAGGRGDTGGAQ